MKMWQQMIRYCVVTFSYPTKCDNKVTTFKRCLRWYFVVTICCHIFCESCLVVADAKGTLSQNARLDSCPPVTNHDDGSSNCCGILHHFDTTACTLLRQMVLTNYLLHYLVFFYQLNRRNLPNWSSKVDSRIRHHQKDQHPVFSKIYTRWWLVHCKPSLPSSGKVCRGVFSLTSQEINSVWQKRRGGFFFFFSEIQTRMITNTKTNGRFNDTVNSGTKWDITWGEMQPA